MVGKKVLRSGRSPANDQIALFVKGPTTSIIKLAAKIGPGPGNGTIIKTTDQGTRIADFA